ncbi:MAG: PIG-L family deacetylase [Acidobacteriota bacterium]|jgi:LmbE family N-acetylglucosaminyl deacetylase|nr:MAG: hypothetical protein DIU54_11635 [Acidobacteriota bacterium]
MMLRLAGTTLFVVLLALVRVSAQQATPAVPPDYTFTATGSRWLPVALSGDGTRFELTWPETGDDWDTALLSIGVAAASAAGDESSSPAPCLVVTAGPYTDRQYFSPRDVGARWLNLSHLPRDLAPGTRVSIEAHGMTLGTGTTTLRLFARRPALDGPVLVLAPHPDDAEIAAFALYATTNATVVTVTSGNAGAPTYEAVFDDGQEAGQYRFKGRIRTIDSITVPLQGGVPPERAANLGYFDARLAAMYQQPTSVIPEMYGPNTDIGVYRRYNVSPLVGRGSRESTWTNLVDDLYELLRRVRPEVIAAPHPQLDTHLDHQFTTVALVEALERWNRDVTLLLYTNHADSNRYPYGPAGTLVSLPPPPGPVELDGVFSLPVDRDLQRDKLFALESMHDLRFSPTRQYQLALGDGRAIAPEKEGPGPDITYLRRGPRSNELFFVYDRASVTRMMDAFLAPWRARRGG